jgi:exodeoxyribonuclease VII small subunit
MSSAARTAAEKGHPSLDQLLETLEATLQRLADPAAPLERAVTDYETARRLLAAAEQRLEAARRRIADSQPAGD